MIILPNEIKLISQDGNKASFEISPLYPGYGVTIGNSLRRILLSSLEGAAITSVKINGVAHEFSTIPNVLEDVLDIILNLKRINFKVVGEGPFKITLDVSGEKEVKAGDFKLPPDVEVINKDQLIATLTDKKAELKIEADVERGIGYVPVEQRQKEKLPVGKIALDAIFSPVKKVSYKVENIRVGQRTDFNKLIIDIETDGSITPQNALINASEILVNQFKTISEARSLREVKEEVKSFEEIKEIKKKRGRPKKITT